MLGFSPLPFASCFFAVSSCNWLMSFRLDNTANANQKATKGVNRFFLLHFWLDEFFFFLIYLLWAFVWLILSLPKRRKAYATIWVFCFLSFSKHICFRTGFLLLTRFISPLNFCFNNLCKFILEFSMSCALIYKCRFYLIYIAILCILYRVPFIFVWNLIFGIAIPRTCIYSI